MVFVGRSTAVTESVVFPMRLAFRFMGWTVPIRATVTETVPDTLDELRLWDRHEAAVVAGRGPAIRTR